MKSNFGQIMDVSSVIGCQSRKLRSSVSELGDGAPAVDHIFSNSTRTSSFEKIWASS